jgi:hypothetical protein
MGIKKIVEIIKIIFMKFILYMVAWLTSYSSILLRRVG